MVWGRWRIRGKAGAIHVKRGYRQASDREYSSKQRQSDSQRSIYFNDKQLDRKSRQNRCSGQD